MAWVDKENDHEQECEQQDWRVADGHHGDATDPRRSVQVDGSAKGGGAAGDRVSNFEPAYTT
jgi:hypothetical protein